MGLSRRAYARHRKQHGLPGTSDTAVRAAITDGRIAAALLADKTIDPAKADALWGTNSSRSPSAGDGVAEVPVNGSGPVQGSELTQARVRKTDLDAQKAELAVGRMRGELIDRERALRLVYDFFRRQRDELEAWPARVAPTLAAELDVDEGTLQRILREYVEDHLRELAAIETLRLE